MPSTIHSRKKDTEKCAIELTALRKIMQRLEKMKARQMEVDYPE